MMDPDGVIASWNPGAERILGYAAEEIVGRQVSTFYTAEDAARGWPAEELRIAASGRFEDEGWRVRKDGTRFLANVVVTPIHDGCGELVGFAKVTQDLTERERARRALRASEESFRLLVESVRDYAILMLDADGNIASWNAGAERIKGYAEEEILGRHVSTFYTEEDLARGWPAEELTIAAAEGRLEDEGWRIRKDGSRFWANVVITALRGPQGDLIGFAKVTRDLTERRRAELEREALLERERNARREAERLSEELGNQAEQLEEQSIELEAQLEELQESETSYRSLFDSLSELVYIQDLKGRFLNVNEAVLRRYGYEREELIGRTPEFLIHESGTDMAAVQDHFRRVCAGEPQRFEFWARTRDGETFPMEVTLARGRHFGEDVIIAVARDITERKRAEVVAERSREFYMSIFDRFPALIWRADPTGACDYFNEAWLEFTGRTLEQELGRGWVDGVHPEDEDERRATAGAAYAARQPFEMEYRLRHRTGEYRWIRDLGRPVHNLEGRFIGYIGGAFDIDEHRRTEAQLRQAQKMEAVGRLAGGIAHDFNNVLLVIKGNAQLAMADLPPENPLLPELQEIGDAADRAANLTRQLLSFSRQQVLQPKVLDLNAIISNLERMLRRTLGEDIEFVSVLDPQIGRVRADPGQMEQILMNLAVNARDAMPKGGKLITETKNFELGERLAGNYPYDVQPGSYVMLSISDTGTGMTREVRDRLFEPFFTTKPHGEGTGLGLSTVYGIVKQSGGYIWAYSEEGQGTSFTVLLPRVDADVHAVPDRTRIAPVRSATILLAEDEASVRTIARRMLERLGHIVIEAADGEEALRVAETNGGEIDLLVTDVVMPAMGGRELAERLVARWPDVRVLYTSGYTDEAVVRHGIQDGSAHFLQKPYDQFALAEKVAAALGSRAPNG